MSINRGRHLQIDLLPFARDDALADLLRGLSFLVHQIAVVKLFEAGAAVGGVGTFKATVQALVALAIAIAVARLLIDGVGDPGRQFVGMGLKRVLVFRSQQSLLGQ